MLYLIEILHQTTTSGQQRVPQKSLYLIEILHQTTTCSSACQCSQRCILSKFYIKPQLFIDTSPSPICCILSKFYIKPQQKYNESIKHWRCILSKFYIKPQLVRGSIRRSSVVSYRNSTSNHNLEYKTKNEKTLYLIEILHQTTTFPAAFRKSPSCILSKFYIKPQLSSYTTSCHDCCILSKFYIKPQPKAMRK